MSRPACDWTYDLDDDMWFTSCGQSFEFYDGEPTDNNFLYCPYCGKLIETSAEEAGDE